MDIPLAALDVLFHHQGKPVVIATINEEIARSEQWMTENAYEVKVRREDWKWPDEQIIEETTRNIQYPVMIALTRHKQKGLVHRISIKRGPTGIKQARKMRMFYSDSHQLVSCLVAYQISKKGIKMIEDMNLKRRQEANDRAKEKETIGRLLRRKI